LGSLFISFTFYSACNEAAHSNPFTSSVMSVTLTLLGTGTPRPSAQRAGSGYLVQIGGECLLFDCGPGVHYRVLQKGLSPIRVSHLFLTHLHYDHCGDFAVFELVRWDQAAGKLPDLTVIGPEGTRQMSDRLFGDDGVFAADIAARTQHPASIEVYESRGGRGPRHRPAPIVVELSDGKSHAANGWSVTCAQVVHCEPQLTTLAYRLDTPAGSIVFGADTSPTPRLTALARGADVLIHMCHFLNRPGIDARIAQSCSGHLDAATTARDAGVARLVLVHITPEVEAPENRGRLLAEVAAIFPGPVSFGEDGTEIPLVEPIAPRVSEIQPA
jgi:ribonuclease Z